ncbi:MAG TPA: hypothetical protein VM305_04465 [Candidatus Limnocylindrales bacterium]|nr:hypothetical protein [Candidatus Limnocylindrales bacterium]
MSTHVAAEREARGTSVLGGIDRGAAVPIALYLVGVAVYALAGRMVTFAVNEGSAYYVAVARNLLSGRGLTIDAIWSYAREPLVLPRPAFELWQPLASLVSAGGMALTTSDLAGAQLAMAALGALLAPMAWFITMEASAALGLGKDRSAVLALGAGALTLATGPLLVAVVLPDSTMPFAVLATAIGIATAGSLRTPPERRAQHWFVIGVIVGLAWLARHEAVWLALTAVLVAAGRGTLRPRLLFAACLGGLVIATPWLARNLLVFGTPLPGQVVDNAVLLRNDQIFAYLEPPSVEAFLAAGPTTWLSNVATALVHNAANVILIPAAPVALAGLVALAILMARRPDVRATSLGVLALAGTAIFVATAVLFPVATLWGTFQHAAGFVHVALTVAAVLGLDSAVRAIGKWRRWHRSNAWLAPVALPLMLLPMTWLTVSSLSAHAAHHERHWQALGRAVLRLTGTATGNQMVVISDHPIWLAEATGLSAIALPAEPLASVTELAREFDASLVVISASRGQYPALLRSQPAGACFRELAPGPGQPLGAAIFEISEACR